MPVTVVGGKSNGGVVRKAGWKIGKDAKNLKGKKKNVEK